MQSNTLKPAAEGAGTFMPPQGLFFDFGNVLAFFDHRKACGRLALLSNGRFTENGIYAELFKPGGLEQQYDCGEISTGHFMAEIERIFNLSAEPRAIEQAWCDIFALNDPIIELLHQLKDRNYRLFLASNTNPLHYKWIKEKYAEELSLFDGEIISFQIGFRKPEKGFFEACVQRSGIPSSQSVFIDDRLDFVQAAREVGLEGVCYTSIPDLTDDLEALGVTVKPGLSGPSKETRMLS
jgi:HAD superfamily hydrolase (TIGR01509 family)